MTISKDLFLAILSMDAYNRGYGSGINDGGNNDPDGLGISGSIGFATIGADSSVLVDDERNRLDENLNFATAVGIGDDTMDAGTTIISYRGTDERREMMLAGR